MLAQTLDVSIDKVDLFSLGYARQARHTHEGTEDKDDHLRPSVDDHITHLEVEVTHTAIGRGVIAEGVLRLGDADGEA